VRFDDVDYSSLPNHMQEGASDYVSKGSLPGGFLMAVLSNDLVGAFGQADIINTHAMRDWAAWLHNEAPSECWGSREKVYAWGVARRAEAEVVPHG